MKGISLLASCLIFFSIAIVILSTFSGQIKADSSIEIKEDNSLTNYGYIANGTYLAYFKNKSSGTSAQPILVKYKDYAITITPNSLKFLGQTNNHKKASDINVVNSTATYSGQFGSGIDLQYTYQKLRLKEDLIINTLQDLKDNIKTTPSDEDILELKFTVRSFDLSNDTLDLKIGNSRLNFEQDLSDNTTDQKIEFLNEYNKTIFYFQRPILLGNHTNNNLNFTYSISRFGNLFVKIQIPYKYLNDSTNYPIKIDPSLIIEIIDAEHLDENRTFIENVYDKVKTKDGVWTDYLNTSHFLRVTFEETLNSSNAITIFAKSENNESAKIEVYEKDNDTIIAIFENITFEGWYDTQLTNLTESQDVFDLKIKQAPISFDYVYDPLTKIEDVARVPCYSGPGHDADSCVITEPSHYRGDTLWINFSYNSSLSGLAADYAIRIEGGGTLINVTCGAGDEFKVLSITTNCPNAGVTCTDEGDGTADFVTDGSSFSNQIIGWWVEICPNAGFGVHTILDDIIVHTGNADVDTVMNHFVINATPIIITIVQPWNLTYNNNSIDFNITANQPLTWARVQLLSTNHSMTNQSGQWQYFNNTLSDGTYNAIFWVNDTSGNMNTTNRWFTIDNTPPQITIIRPWNLTYNNNSIDFNITANEALSWAAVEILNYNNTLTNQSGQWQYFNNTLSDGSYQATFWFNDTAGNMNTTSRWFTIDTTYPQITIIQPWNLTYNNNSIDFNITANEVLNWANVQLLSTNNSLTNQSGQWQYFNGTLADGTYEAVFWFNDTVGNMNTTNRWFTIDTTDITDPQITIIQPWNLTYNNNSIDFNITANEVLNWTSVQLLSTNHSMTNQSGQWQYFNGTLADGTYEAVFWFNDTAGNMNTTSRWFTISTDSTPPKITIQSPTNSSYNSNNIWFNATLNETGSWCGVDYGYGNNSMTNSSGNWNYNNASMDDGTYNAIFYCNDTNGNMNTTDIWFTIDTAYPQITIIQPWNLTYANNSIDFNITANEILSWANVQLLSTNNSLTNQSGQWQYFNGTLADGTYEAVFWFNDTAGNMNTTSRWFTIDTTYPQITIIQPWNLTYNNNSIDFNITANEVLNWANVQLLSTNNSLTNQSGQWQYFNNTLSDGSYQATFWFNDSVGNMNTTSRWFSIDTTVPTITITQPWNTTYQNFSIVLDTNFSEAVNMTYSWDDSTNLTGCSLRNSYTITYGEYYNSSETNLSAVWHFNENNLGTLHDDSGNSLNGILNNFDWSLSSNWTTGMYGYGLKFDGSDDFISINENQSKFNFTDNWTVSIWFKVDKFYASHQSIFSDWNSSVNSLWLGLSDTIGGNKIRVGVKERGGAITTYNFQTTILTGKWYHAVFIYNSTDGYMYNYINGTIDGGSMWIGDFIKEINSNWAFGKTHVTATYFNGTIDEVIIFNRVLSASEINNLYNRKTLPVGGHKVTVYVTDTVNYFNSSTRWFTIDNTPPQITIIQPWNLTYNNNTIDYNITANEALSWAAVEILGYNNTLTNQSGQWQYFNNTLSDGSYQATFWFNDSVGNMNTTSRWFTIDTSAPQHENLTYPTTKGENYLWTVRINVTDLSNFTVEIDIDGSNNTMTQVGSTSGYEYTTTFSVPSDTSYSFTIWMNDTFSQMNSTTGSVLITDYELETPGGGPGTISDFPEIAINRSKALNKTRRFVLFTENDTILSVWKPTRLSEITAMFAAGNFKGLMNTLRISMLEDYFYKPNNIPIYFHILFKRITVFIAFYLLIALFIRYKKIMSKKGRLIKILIYGILIPLIALIISLLIPTIQG